MTVFALRLNGVLIGAAAVTSLVIALHLHQWLDAVIGSALAFYGGRLMCAPRKLLPDSYWERPA
jgi:hypothetical protein